MGFMRARFDFFFIYFLIYFILILYFFILFYYLFKLTFFFFFNFTKFKFCGLNCNFFYLLTKKKG
jgi:hypothetical protein